jgi:hypothetical protein
MKYEKHDVTHGIKRITHSIEGLTSLIAGSYVLSLAVTKSNVLVRVALGVAGAYLILRSGGKLHYGGVEEVTVVTEEPKKTLLSALKS